MTAPPKNIYTLTQAANLCGINRATLWRWIKAERLTAYQTPTGRYKIRKTDLDRFIQTELKFLSPPLHSDPLKILIIDDDFSFIKFLKTVLTDQGYEVDEACNGFQAGLKITEFSPSVLILDLYMPEMDGFEVCRQIKSNASTKHIKILALSGFGTPDTKERILGLGADAYAEKPLSPKKLLAYVNKLLTV